MSVCPYCYGPLEAEFTASKDDHVVKAYRCKVCRKPQELWHYRYEPVNCPKHHWMFSHREFQDNPHTHSIVMVFICDRCGARREEHQDTKAAGITGRVEIEHPLVWPTIALNKSFAKRLFTKEEIRDFWADADNELIIGK